MQPTLLVIIPTYGAFEYARRAVASALEHTRADVNVAVIDDASPGLEIRDSTLEPQEYIRAVLHRLGKLLVYGRPERRLWLSRFRENGGLTRSWNEGLVLARDRGIDYACVTNSDVIFTPGWDVSLIKALDEFALIGPVTNAPGTEDGQFIGRYTQVYERTDDAQKLALVAAELARINSPPRAATINGFCMMAKTKTWWDNAYDPFRAQVFKPLNTHNSRGQPNPTPTMTLNEYELQRRWHAAKLRTGYSPASYVFHYRAASRGDQYKRGDWLRLPQ